jgi:hypothetical protein
MNRLRGVIAILMESPHYFTRSPQERLDLVKELLDRELVRRVARAEKDLAAAGELRQGWDLGKLTGSLKAGKEASEYLSILLGRFWKPPRG